MAFRINKDRVSSRAWGDVDNTSIRARLSKGLDDDEAGADTAVREVYAVIKGDGPLDENPSGRWWGPHHEVSPDGSVTLNRAGLGAAAAAVAGGRASPDLTDAEKARAIRHLSRHYVDNDIPLPDGFQASGGEMHVVAGAVGEMNPGDIPLSAECTEADRAALLKGDDDPLEVVIEVAPGKSSRGWHYTPAALQKMVSHVQTHTLAGIKGHQRDENLPQEFVDPSTHWIGAVWQDDKAYFRGLIDKSAPDLKRWIRSRRIKQPSIFTRPVLSRVNGETHVVDLEPLGIDWAPLDRPGMQTSRVVAWGEMDAIGGEPFEHRTPPGGGDDLHTREDGHMPTVKENIDGLRDNGATPSQVIQGMNWRAADVLPVLMSSDRRGVAESLDQATLQHVAAGEMAKSHRPQDLVPALGLDLAAIASIVDEPQWKRVTAADKAVGEMAAALGLPEGTDSATVLTKVTELQTAVKTTAQAGLKAQVEKVVAAGEMAVASPVRALVTDRAMLELQPGADEAAIKSAITKVKADPTIKPILDANLGTTVIRPVQAQQASGEMNGSNGHTDVGLPTRRRSI